MKADNLEITYLPLDDIVAYANNAKLHPDEHIDQIVASIKQFGFNNPILIDENGVIIAGHGRYYAARRLKLDKVPTVRLAHLSEIEKKAYIIADNKLGMVTGFDHELLKLELESILEEWEDVSITGFDEDEVEQILSGFTETLPGRKAHEDEDTVPDIPKEAETITGDVYEIGPHKLICGDSGDMFAFDTLFGKTMADMVFTDPPYNVDYVGKTKDALKIENDSMANEDFYKFLYDCFVNIRLYTKQGGAIYIAHADSEGLNFRKAMIDSGFLLKQCLIWVKQQFVMGRQDYHCQHEPILYGWVPGASHEWYADRKQTTIWNFDRPARSEEHPTMKPVELVAYAISNSSKQGDTILDAFGGSGTTMVAAHTLARVARLIEKSPHYCDVIVRRMHKLWPDIDIKRNGESFVPQVE